MTTDVNDMAESPSFVLRTWTAALLLVLAGAGASAAPKPEAASGPKSFADATRGLDRSAGFVDVYRDAAKGQVLLAVRQLDAPFLLVTSLPYGLGSNDVGLDRGQPGQTRLVRFRRHGAKLLLIQDNTSYVALSNDPKESASAREAFAESVLWAGELKSEPGTDGSVLVDFGPFLTTDQHGIGARLNATKQGKYAVDAARSAVLAESARSFPDNTEFEALLTFAGPGEGEYVRQVAPDPESLTMRQHVSLVRLPPDGFQPRRYHPGSGAFSMGYYDFAQPLGASLDVRFQPRFRLEKTNPDAAKSPVRKPIVFYLDPGTPEPVRSALLEGASWWRAAFEEAGFEDAYRVELRPDGIDPMDIRYSVITWVHRATRGWSYGGSIADPRTGEMIKGSVTLGSQRVRQDLMIAQALLAPFGKPNEAELKAEAEAMALARLRQLSAHEVGHALGFAHNFAASRIANGSVMDYPHPLIEIDADGGIDLADAYGVGVGPWDKFLVKHAYLPFKPEAEASALAALRREAAQAGLLYIGDDDGRAGSSAHPDALLWDMGTDTLKSYDTLLAVRRKALDAFSLAVLPPDRQTGEIEARLVPVYLLHRYQLEAVARLLGGRDYQYGTGADANAGTRAVAGDRQRAALARLTAALGARELALPASVLDLVTPPGNDYARNREYFQNRSAPIFDAYAAVASAAAVGTQFLFDPARLNRVAFQHARDAALPGVAEVLDRTFAATWRSDASSTQAPAALAVQLSANWVTLDALFATLDGGALHPPVESDVRAALAGLRDWLSANAGAGGTLTANRREAADTIARYLRDPATVKRHPAPVVPPGAPI